MPYQLHIFNKLKLKLTLTAQKLCIINSKRRYGRIPNGFACGDVSFHRQAMIESSVNIFFNVCKVSSAISLDTQSRSSTSCSSISISLISENHIVFAISKLISSQVMLLKIVLMLFTIRFLQY